MRFAAFLIAAVGCIVSLAGLPSPARAAACYSLPSTVQMLTLSESFHMLLDDRSRDQFVHELEASIGFHFPSVSNVLIAEWNGALVYGLEIKGCLTSPLPIPGAPPVRRPVKGVAA